MSRKLKTPDSFFSLEPYELKKLVNSIRILQAALGQVHYGFTDGEKSMKAQAILDDLNEWHTEELDILENPDKYPNRILSGETNGWVYAHKRELEELGYSIRWNNDKKLYKLEPIEEKEN